MLISSIIGIDNRSTMDMDTTIKGFKLDVQNLKNILQKIVEIDIEDNIKFKISKYSNNK